MSRLPYRVFLAALAGLAALAALPALAGNLDFRITNDSGYTLQELYISSARLDRWGNDVLGKGTLESGRSAKVTFPSESNDCVYDLRMVFSDGDEMTDTLNLCETTGYTIN